MSRKWIIVLDRSVGLPRLDRYSGLEVNSQLQSLAVHVGGQGRDAFGKLGRIGFGPFLRVEAFFPAGIEINIDNPIWGKVNELGETSGEKTATSYIMKRSLALAKLIIAAEKGNLEAQEELIDRFYFGPSGRGRKTKAIEWAKRASRQSSHAQTCLGDAYEKGQGVPKDLERALFWYKKAAANGVTHAQVCLGFAYEFGLGTRKSPQNAMRWYHRAARKSVDAAFNIGQHYSEKGGEGLPMT